MRESDRVRLEGVFQAFLATAGAASSADLPRFRWNTVFVTDAVVANGARGVGKRLESVVLGSRCGQHVVATTRSFGIFISFIRIAASALTVAKPLVGPLACLPSPAAGRNAETALEGALECRRRGVADFIGDLLQAVAAVAQPARRMMHAQAGEIVHGGFADHRLETLRQERARASRPFGQGLHRPFRSGVSCISLSALLTSGSRRPASQPVASGGSDRM